MKPTKERESELFTQLERLAAHCPWQRVDIWACRAPAGQIVFTAYVNGADEIGLQSGSSHGKTPTEAVDEYIRDYPAIDANEVRLKKIAELRMQIARLEAVSFDLPPYRPCPQIGNGSGKGATPKPQPASAVTVDL